MFFSLQSRDPGLQANSGRGNKAAPGLSPSPAHQGMGGSRSSGSHRCPRRALLAALPELLAGLSLPWSAPHRLCPSAPDGRISAAVHGFILPGLVLPSGDGFVRTSAPAACSSSRPRRRDSLITSLFDWFHQPVISCLPKLFRQRRQRRTFRICKDKRPERHLPPSAGARGQHRPGPRPLRLSGAVGHVTLLQKPA